MYNRIHVLGASGSGTTTVGRNISKKLDIPLFDSDDYFWAPTDPPYTLKREASLRERMLMADLEKHDRWVLPGFKA